MLPASGRVGRNLRGPASVDIAIRLRGGAEDEADRADMAWENDGTVALGGGEMYPDMLGPTKFH